MIQGYSTVPSRNLIKASMDMLDHAEPITVLGDFGTQKQHPQKSTDTVVFRRTLPFGASLTGTTIEGSQRYVGTPNIIPNQFILPEGTTPNANTIQFQDVTVTLQNYGILFKFTSKTELMYEDDVPEEMSKLVGETLGEVLELVRYGVLRAGSTVMYSNGTSRSAVNTAITLNTLRRTSRTLESNRGKRVTSRVASGPNYRTQAVEPAYLVFVHTDAVADVRNLVGFTRVVDYGSYKPCHPREFGSCEDYRFISSPLLTPFLAAGAVVGVSGMLSVGAVNVDVYPSIVICADAWGQIALKGKSAIKPVILPSGMISHANPMGMFGYVGGQTWFNVVRLNEAWMGRIEHGVTAL
jgi:N4-gp56 family major capsid protein